MRRPRAFSDFAGGLGVMLLVALTTAVPRAQSLHELMTGSIGDMPGDVFDCGQKTPDSELKECGLSFRYYAEEVPDEINAPALPVVAIPGFRPRKNVYLAEPVHSGNFPKAAALGPGHAWHLVWDGIRDADKPSHVGYYAAQSQIVEFGELGNPLSPTCLPVIGQYACFGSIRSDTTNSVHDSPIGSISPIGGLSPIPVPIVTRNGVDKIRVQWEQAAGQTSRDGAPLPLHGYRIFVFPNPEMPPTQAEISKIAIPIGEIIPISQTSFDIDRSLPEMASAVTLSPAIRMVYRGGIQSLWFSANGPATGLAFPDAAATREVDDAAAGAGAVPRAIDIEAIYMEIRQKPNAAGADEPYFHATVDLVGEPDGKLLEGTRVRLFVDFNDEGLAETFTEPGKKGTEELTLVATMTRKGEGAVQAEFSGLPGMDASRLDTTAGRVTFALPLEQLTAGVPAAKLRAADQGGGKRRILVWAEASRESALDRAPNTNDGGPPSVAGEVIRFTF